MYLLHDGQKQVASDTHRYRVIAAGRRFGKSTLIALEMLAIALVSKNGRVPYYAPSFDDARSIMWDIIKDVCEPVTLKTNESRLEIRIRNIHGGQSLILLCGWEAVQGHSKGVGVKNHHIFLDEVSKYNNFQRAWQEILIPTLTDVGGGATFISTCNGFNHFWD